MPVEYVLLQGQPEAFERCPRCGAEPFVGFMRGQVVSAWRWVFRRWIDYCSVICSECKEIVGHESPP